MNESMNKISQRILLSVFSLSLIVVCLQQTSGQVEKTPAQTPAAPASLSANDRSQKALQLFRKGKFDEAVQEYSAMQAADPRSAQPYVGLVRVYLKQKKTAEAYDAAAKALAIDPKSDAVRAVVGEVYFRQGKLPEAEREFIALVIANTSEARAYLGLGRVYWATSHYKLAKSQIDKAHGLDPADPDIRKMWIRTLNRKERADELTAYLAGGGNDDGEERKYLESTLELYKDGPRPCHLAATVNEAEIGLDRLLTDPTRIRGYGLGVKVNGVSSKLLLDTGAGGILINRNTAERAGIKPISRHDVRGIGDRGAQAGFVGYADSVKIGNLEFQNCWISVVDKTSVAGVDGLIGAVFFDDFLVDLDFPREKLKLSHLPLRPGDPAPGAEASPEKVEFHDRYVSTEMKSFTPVYRFGHDLLVSTQLNDLPPKLFLLDTGAFRNTISPSAAREVTSVSTDSNARVRGLSGTVEKVFRADEFTIHFGRLREKNQDTVSFDLKRISDSIGTEVSGILGFATLTVLEIKINYRDGLVDFIYKPK
jgi:tetratricopeptide (TPR) repeat protein